MAFVDFVKDHPEVGYATVDTDFGCAVFGRRGTRPTVPAETIDAWKATRRDVKAAYRFVSEHRVPLLNMMSVEAFKTTELACSRPG